MGYDDEFRVASAMVPALTTMALPLREMGAAAMTGLLAELGHRPGADDDDADSADQDSADRRRRPIETLVPCRLVLRESTGQVPAGRG